MRLHVARSARLWLAVALLAIPGRASSEPLPVGAQTARDRLSIGTQTASAARACRPYELRYPRTTPVRPSLSDLWWELGSSDNRADIVLDRLFVARRIAIELYGWFRGDTRSTQRPRTGHAWWRASTATSSMPGTTSAFACWSSSSPITPPGR